MNFTNKKPIRRFAIATGAIALSFSLAVPQAAQAAAQAYTGFSVTGMTYRDITNGGVLGLGTDVSIDALFERTRHVAGRNGAAGSPDVVTTTQFGLDLAGPPYLKVDGLMACVGGGCGAVGENSFAQGPIASGDYSRADSSVLGSGLDLSAIGGGIDARSFDLVAESISQGANDDSNGANYTSNSTFTIVPVTDLKIGLELLASTLVELELQAPFLSSGSVLTGDTSVSFTLTHQDNSACPECGIINTSANAGLLSQGAFNNAVGTQSVGTGGAVLFTWETATELLAGVAYNVNVNFGAETNLLVEVPEPSVLGLLGLGLIGFSAAAFKRKKA